MVTRTDPSPTEWAIDDEVFQLREWGTDTIYQLPELPAAEFEVGSSMDCALRLRDASGRLSGRHAWIALRSAGWIIEDLDSKNGLRLDGTRRFVAPLQPGAELGIGSLTLIAESRRFTELRGFLARLLGWDASRRATVDLALRALRLAAGNVLQHGSVQRDHRADA